MVSLENEKHIKLNKKYIVWKSHLQILNFLIWNITILYENLYRKTITSPKHMGAAFLAVPVPTGAPSTVEPCIKIGARNVSYSSLFNRIPLAFPAASVQYVGCTVYGHTLMGPGQRKDAVGGVVASRKVVGDFCDLDVKSQLPAFHCLPPSNRLPSDAPPWGEVPFFSYGKFTVCIISKPRFCCCVLNSEFLEPIPFQFSLLSRSVDLTSGFHHLSD
jgi:hypothetical protein